MLSIRIATLLLLILSCAAVMSFAERRLLGLFQNRYGPNRLGYQGLLQPLADLVKMMSKEDWIPPFADRFFFILAPSLALMVPLAGLVVISPGPGRQLLSSDVDVLFLLMIAGLSSYPVMLAGWSSRSKYALLGTLRAALQTLSYEIFLGTSVMGVVMRAGSCRIEDVVGSQRGLWNVAPQFLGFIPFAVASFGICHRHPYDQPESEQELAGGYHVEYSGMKFGLFFVAEYVNIIVCSATMVTFFCGGWLGPAWLPPEVWFVLKMLFLMPFFVLARTSLPRPKWDQMMRFGWQFCLPLGFVNLLITSAAVLMRCA